MALSGNNVDVPRGGYRAVGHGGEVLLEREEYRGPILPDQLWRSRSIGTAHGSGQVVRVVKLTAGGRVQFVMAGGGGRLGRERRLGMDEAGFRGRFELHKQVSERYLQAVRERERAVVIATTALDVLDAVEHGEAPEIEREMRVEMIAQQLTPAPVTPPAPPAEEAASPESQTPTDVGRDGTTEAPPDVDPLDDFLNHGRATVVRLDEELLRVGEDRELARLELEELDGKLGTLRTKRDRIAGAIAAALRVATGQPVVTPEAPPPASEPPPEGVTERSGYALMADAVEYARRMHMSTEKAAARLKAQAARVANGERRLGRRRSPAGVANPGLWVWLDEFVGARARVTTAEIIDACGARFGLDRQTRSRRVGAYLTMRTLHPRPGEPRLQRVAQGVYEVAPAPAVQ